MHQQPQQQMQHNRCKDQDEPAGAKAKTRKGELDSL